MHYFMRLLGAISLLVMATVATARPTVLSSLLAASPATGSTISCDSAPLVDTDNNFCSDYPSFARCKCHESGGGVICNESMEAIFNAMMNFKHTLENACDTDPDHELTQAQCVENWCCYIKNDPKANVPSECNEVQCPSYANSCA